VGPKEQQAVCGATKGWRWVQRTERGIGHCCGTLGPWTGLERRWAGIGIMLVESVWMGGHRDRRMHQKGFHSGMGGLAKMNRWLSYHRTPKEEEEEEEEKEEGLSGTEDRMTNHANRGGREG